MNIVSPIKGGKIPLGYSMLDTGHPGKHSGNTPGDIQENTQETLQVVSFFVMDIF